MAAYNYQITNNNSISKNFTASNQTFYIAAKSTVTIGVDSPIIQFDPSFTVIQILSPTSSVVIQTSDPSYNISTDSIEMALLNSIDSNVKLILAALQLSGINIPKLHSTYAVFGLMGAATN